MPKDQALMSQLAAAAVAAAEAGKREIEARGAAKALLLSAQAEAEACRERASGSKDAADTLTANPIAVEMERIRVTGAALGTNSTMFFGASAGDMTKLLSNPAVVQR